MYFRSVKVYRVEHLLYFLVFYSLIILAVQLVHFASRFVRNVLDYLKRWLDPSDSFFPLIELDTLFRNLLFDLEQGENGHRKFRIEVFGHHVRDELLVDEIGHLGIHLEMKFIRNSENFT